MREEYQERLRSSTNEQISRLRSMRHELTMLLMAFEQFGDAIKWRTKLDDFYTLSVEITEIETRLSRGLTTHVPETVAEYLSENKS